MGSSRLPGKVMKPLCGKPVLWHDIERVKRAGSKIDEITIATTTNAADDIIYQQCMNWGISCYRGSETDVLDRYYQAALKSKHDRIIRITSDCPLIDPDVIVSMLDRWDNNAAEGFTPDYLSNVIPLRTFPKGLDVEIFSFAALETAATQSTNPFEREHVTPHIYRRPEKFKLAHYCNKKNDISAHRWTLDTPEDYQLFEMIYADLYDPSGFITTSDILDWYKQDPARALINQKGFHSTLDLSYREIKETDCDLLLEWRNRAHVRNMMKTTHVIHPDEHKKWFPSVIGNPNYIMISSSNFPIGIINFKLETNDTVKKSAEWGFYLGWNDLPSGTGEKLCRMGIEYAKTKLALSSLHAEVEKHNVKSIVLHQKLGFVQTSGTDRLCFNLTL